MYGLHLFSFKTPPPEGNKKGVSAKGATVGSILSPLRTLPLRVKRCKLHRPKRKMRKGVKK